MCSGPFTVRCGYPGGRTETTFEVGKIGRIVELWEAARGRRKLAIGLGLPQSRARPGRVHLTDTICSTLLGPAYPLLSLPTKYNHPESE
jgi:hypothetical protein